jgi:hypothetical protein
MCPKVADAIDRESIEVMHAGCIAALDRESRIDAHRGSYVGAVAVL